MKVLSYFDLNGLAEGIRYILLYTDQKFDDTRYEHKSWPIKEIKEGLPYGKLPILEEDGGRILNQSVAIARYVAANTELLPSDPWEQAVLDATVLTINDFSNNVATIHNAKSPEEKDANRKTFNDETLDYYFSRFEKKLQDNNGYFGGKLSWADFMFVGAIEFMNLFLQDKIEKGYPAITKLVETIQTLPRVKEYVKNRKPYEI